jgi:hypothetical protein
MPTPQKQIVNRVLATLDNTAEQVKALADAGKIDPRLAASICHDIDTFADRFEIATFGKENLMKRAAMLRQAKVMQRDSDEKYMETFQNPIKTITTDADEPYMHKAEPGYNSTKGIDTYDKDISSSVIERDEYNVRDLNEFSPGNKKQPSWERGPAGKSTAIGSSPSKPAPRQAAAKGWAP